MWGVLAECCFVCTMQICAYTYISSHVFDFVPQSLLEVMAEEAVQKQGEEPNEENEGEGEEGAEEM